MSTELDQPEPPIGMLSSYALDLQYVDPLQPELLSRFIYWTARVWERSLHDRSYTSCLTAIVDALLRRDGIVEATLGTPANDAFVGTLMAILLSHMAETERLYMDGRWLLHFGTLARLHPCFSLILERWVKLDAAGLARCYVFLIALLKLDSHRNPLLSNSQIPEPWAGFTEDGAVPWREENIDALATWLEPSLVERQLARCALILPESDQWFLEELRDEPAKVYDERLRELIANAKSGAPAHWSDLYGARRE